MMIKVKFVTALMVIFLSTDAALACEISAQDIGIPQQQYDKIILESERDGKDGCTVIRGISRVIAVYSAAKAIESDPTSPLPPEGQPQEPKEEGDANPYLDRARYGLYPPGSTFKVVTAMAACLGLRPVENAFGASSSMM